MKSKNPCRPEHGDAACAEMPDLKRLNYFYGQMLGVNDFRTEQTYFREKQKLHNRCLHGYGTVCGLMVRAAPSAEECKSVDDATRARLQAVLDKLQLEAATKEGRKDDAEKLRAEIERLKQELEGLPPKPCGPVPSQQLVLECGLALDCEGNEIVVPHPYKFDPWHLLSDDDRRLVEGNPNGVDLYLSICYCEQPVDPVRPVIPDACGATPECTHGKLRDAYRLHLGSAVPPADAGCDSCCTCCEEACLVLAKLHGYRKGVVTGVDNSVRRLVETSAYPATTITGISWTHGATYSASDGGEIIGTWGPGIRVDFSRPVLTSTLTSGVVELWVVEGGRTQHSGVYYLEGAFEDFAGQDAVSSFRYTYQGDENLDPGDRVMVTIRCAFILDECCRPVDGAHVGGRVPIIDAAEFKKFDRTQTPPRCAVRPPGYGPWTSGAGTPGASFESWFFIEAAKGGEKRRPQEIRK